MIVSVKPAPTASASAEPADEPIASSSSDFKSGDPVDLTAGDAGQSGILEEGSAAAGWYYNLRGAQGGTAKTDSEKGTFSVSTTGNNANDYIGKHATSAISDAENAKVEFKFDYKTNTGANTGNNASKIYLLSSEGTATPDYNAANSDWDLELITSDELGMTDATKTYHVEIVADNAAHTATINITDAEVQLTVDNPITIDTKEAVINTIAFRPGRGSKTDVIANYSDAVYKTEVEPEESTEPKYSITTEADEADAEVKYYAVTTSSEPAPEESPEATPIVTESKEPIEALDDVKPGTVVEYEVTEKKSVADGYTYTVDVTGADAKDNRFTMPEGNVTVKVTATQTMLPDKLAEDADMAEVIFANSTQAGEDDTTILADGIAKKSVKVLKGSNTAVADDNFIGLSLTSSELMTTPGARAIYFTYDFKLDANETFATRPAGSGATSNQGPTTRFIADGAGAISVTNETSSSGATSIADATGLTAGHWYRGVMKGNRDADGHVAAWKLSVYNIGDDDATGAAVFENVDLAGRNTDRTMAAFHIAAASTTGDYEVEVDNVFAYTPSTTYTITKNPAENGSFEVPESAREGEVVNIITSPNPGAVLKNIEVKAGEATILNGISTTSFVMPKEAVTITVTFEAFQPFEYTNDFNELSGVASASSNTGGLITQHMANSGTSAPYTFSDDSDKTVQLDVSARANGYGGWYIFTNSGTTGSDNALAMVSGQWCNANRGPRMHFTTPTIPDGGQLVLTADVKKDSTSGTVLKFNDDTGANSGTDIPLTETYQQLKVVIKNTGGVYSRTVTLADSPVGNTEAKNALPVFWADAMDQQTPQRVVYWDNLSITTAAEQD